MKRVSFSIIFVGAMIALLVVLAVLQYIWLGQISDGERERLKARLDSDTLRFAEDFNREIQSAYFNFKLSKSVLDGNDWSEFNDRYEFWRGRAAHPEMIRSISFVDVKSDAVKLYDPAAKAFVPGVLPESVAGIRSTLTGNEVPPVSAGIPALVMPLYESNKPFRKIVIRATDSAPPEALKAAMPDPEGFLIIELDKTALTNGIIGDLKRKYFSETDGADYEIAVVDRQNRTIFETKPLAGSDATANLFDLAPNDFVFYSNRELMEKAGGVKRTVVFSTTTNHVATKPTADNSNVQLKLLTDDIKPRFDVREQPLRTESESAWILKVQHSSGSLEAFVANTKRKNLAISFGILSLLGASVMFIFLSAQRARRLAQRQVDFVSSVSHEFRTPLAVIYSASENLADGVAREPEQISRYGELIKNEGRKLSSMVEQILEFAGARSGKRSYDFRELDLDRLIDAALEECGPLIDHEDFAVERERCGGVAVKGDSAALIGAFQNLIANSIKYSNGSKWMRIGCAKQNGKVSVAFEDKGIGIAAVDLKQIFEPFFRSKSVVDEQIRGNGLGLSLVKETVEAHGGKIHAESELGAGSTFVIELPLVTGGEITNSDITVHDSDIA
jgi:signal transduction histidine kinase